MSERSVLSEQRALWSSNPRDWATIAEPQNRELFDVLLDVTGVGPGTRLLDIARGSGYAAGERRVRDALVDAIEPFRVHAGAISIHNVFRYVVGVKV